MDELRSGPSPDQLEPGRGLTAFTVSEHGTLCMEGVEEPTIWAHLADINVDKLDSAESIITQVDAFAPLREYFRELVEISCDRLEWEWGMLALRDDPLELEHNQKIFEETMLWVDAIRADTTNGWITLLRALNPAGIEKASDDIRAWLDQPIDWQSLEDFPTGVGAQGQALAYFEDFDGSDLEALGIDLVYGDSPGSTYYAAELRGSIDEANGTALALGLTIKFIPAPKAAAPTLPAPATGAVRAAVSPQALRDVLTWRLPPTFGAGYDVWAGEVDGLAERHTLPPVDLRHLHSREAFAQAWQRLLECLRNPVHEWVDPAGARHVSVLGTGIYTVALDGTIAVRLWEVDAQGRARLEAAQNVNVSLDPLPMRWLWLDRLERAFVADLAGLHREADRSELAAYAKWAFKVFCSRIKSGCDMRWVRTRIRQAMGLDPLAIDIARRANVLLGQPWVLVSSYNRVIRHMAAHRKLQRDAPRLAPLFDLLCEEQGFPKDGEPLQRLKAFLKAQGLSERGWRMVVKSGSPLLRPVAAFYAIPDAAAVIDYLRLVDLMQWRREPSRAFMETVLALRGLQGAPSKDYSRQYDAIMTILRGVREWFERADAEHRGQVVQGLQEVLDWVDIEGAEAAVRQRQHLNWSWLAQSAGAWRERRLVEHRHGGRTWPVPSGGLTIGEFTVTFIDNAAALHAEAKAMRHCAFDYLERCAAGDYAIASITRRGRRVATAMWSVSGGVWRVAQVAGFANRAPGDELVKVASRALAEWKATTGQVELVANAEAQAKAGRQGL